MKYGVDERNLIIFSNYSNKEKSGDNKSSSYEDYKKEESKDNSK